jgi:nucleoside-diphosphate-sugar epimerase
MQRAFVTGGSGFLGRHLLRYLRDRGVETLALARSEKAAAAVAKDGAQPVRGDLFDADAIAEGLRGCDVVFHAAAHVEEWGPYEAFYRSNVEATDLLLRLAREAGVRRFVHVSTDAVLLDGSPLVDVDETRPRPTNVLFHYGKTKGIAEEHVCAAATEGFTTVVIRPRLIWGPEDTSVLTKMATAVRTGRFKWVDGGNYLTHTCHVTNVCEGAFLAAERGTPAGVYFLTDGPAQNARTFYTALLATQGVTPGSGSVPRWLALPAAKACEWLWRLLGREDPPPLSVAAVHLIGGTVTVSDARARRELGYTGAVSVEAGLAEMDRLENPARRVGWPAPATEPKA